jgi:acetate kinase
MNILVLNSGSSSQKSCLYEIGDALPGDPPQSKWEGKVEWIGGETRYSIQTSQGAKVEDRAAAESRGDAIRRLLQTLWSGKTKSVSGSSDIDVVGHRVVHGGPHHFEPAVVNDDVRAAIENVSVFAPLHNRAELEGMQIVEEVLGPLTQIAVFDTGFHHHMPLAAATYPGPYEWLEQGIRRYGFHGINHQYCAERAARLMRRDLASLKLVTCHLGNGCSLDAVDGGRSIDTTMGFTPLEGLMMGSRSGSVDPGILSYLVREKHFTSDQLDEVLNRKSGLLGISGFSSDMRDIVAAATNGANRSKQERARLALDIYIHRLQSGIGSMIAVLGGADALIFTAGVGENSPEIRAAVCEKLAFLGIQLDPKKNLDRKKSDRDLSTPNSKLGVFVIAAQEDWMIAKQCWQLMGAHSELTG